MFSLFVKIHSTSVYSIQMHLIVHWRLLWMLGSSSHLNSSAECFKIWQIVGWLADVNVVLLLQPSLKLNPRKCRVVFFWMQRAMCNFSVIVVYFPPFFGMTKCWWHNTSVCVVLLREESIAKKIPNSRFKLVPSIAHPFPALCIQ